MEWQLPELLPHILNSHYIASSSTTPCKYITQVTIHQHNAKPIPNINAFHSWFHYLISTLYTIQANSTLLITLPHLAYLVTTQDIQWSYHPPSAYSTLPNTTSQHWVTVHSDSLGTAYPTKHSTISKQQMSKKLATHSQLPITGQNTKQEYTRPLKGGHRYWIIIKLWH